MPSVDNPNDNQESQKERYVTPSIVTYGIEQLMLQLGPARALSPITGGDSPDFFEEY